MPKAPNVGDQAPDFNALDQNLERFFLSKAVKKGKVLLVFYPANDTPVCTAQLCDYRDHLEEFGQLGVQVYGISIADSEDHLKFSQKIHLNFPLLNDYDARITKFYGVMSMLGMPKRALFLVDENRNVLYKHVEILPVFRRESDELVGKISEVLGVPKPVRQEAVHAAHDAHGH